jgi:hypothetical protein
VGRKAPQNRVFAFSYGGGAAKRIEAAPAKILPKIALKF